MTKTGQTNNPGFRTIKAKKGSKAFTLHATFTLEGPIYDAVCIDAEMDEFEIEIDDGCARIDVDGLKYLMLDPDALRQIADLVETAEEHFDTWLDSQMGRDFQADAPDGVASYGGSFESKYSPVLGIRSEA